MPPHQRNVVAELGDEEIDEPAAVFVLFAGHLLEHLRAARVVVVEAFGDIGVDAAVLFLVADGEGQHFALGQVVEIAHGGVLRCFATLKPCLNIGRGGNAKPRGRPARGAVSLQASGAADVMGRCRRGQAHELFAPEGSNLDRARREAE